MKNINNLYNFYSIQSRDILEKYFNSYITLVIQVAKQFNIDLTKKEFNGYHLGFQNVSVQDFDICSDILSKYARLIRNSIIHKRRNRIYELLDPIFIKGIEMPRIELFEPVPNKISLIYDQGFNISHLK